MEWLRDLGKMRLIAIVLLFGLLILGGWLVINNRNYDQKKFTSYDDCIRNGGEFKDVVTVGGQFNACIGPGLASTTQIFLQYSAQNIPFIVSSKETKKENVVEYSGSPSSDLLAFLKHIETGCETKGYYKVLKEVPGRFAKMNYGCLGDPKVDSYYVIAMKLSDKWVELSPTNNLDSEGRPSCLLVDVFKISRDLTDTCFQNTGYDDGGLRPIVYL